MNERAFEKELTLFDYKLSSDRIATLPAAPRDSARLLVVCPAFSTQSLSGGSRADSPHHPCDAPKVISRSPGKASPRFIDSFFRELPKFIPAGALLVFNDTKVIPARLTLFKTTGGAVRVLFVDLEGRKLRTLADRPLEIGSELSLNGKPAFKVLGRDGKYLVLSPLFRGSLRALLEKHGDAPLPPYIKNSPLSKREQRKQYQTVFAKTPGSIAAPTASLHFTPRLLKALKKTGIETAFVTLHVGLGTFAPLTAEHMESGTLHEEEWFIDKKAAAQIDRAKKEGRPVIPVGTTALRTLESAASGRAIKKLRGQTNLFIREGYKFKIADGLITNFHVPKSSLLMLVAAFAGRKKIQAAYHHAIKHDYRFFSFGDGMLIL